MTKLVVIAYDLQPSAGIGYRCPRIIFMLVVYGVLTRKRKTENTRSCSKLCLRGYLQGMFARQPWSPV